MLCSFFQPSLGLEVYKSVYLKGFQRILQALPELLRAILHFGTSIYGQANGEWVVKRIPIRPQSFWEVSAKPSKLPGKEWNRGAIRWNLRSRSHQLG